MGYVSFGEAIPKVRDELSFKDIVEHFSRVRDFNLGKCYADSQYQTVWNINIVKVEVIAGCHEMRCELFEFVLG